VNIVIKINFDLEHAPATSEAFRKNIEVRGYILISIYDFGN